MKKYVAIAALALITGCSANGGMSHNDSYTTKSNTIRQQSVAHSAQHGSHVTRASSVATPAAKQQSMSMQQLTAESAPGYPDWLVNGQYRNVYRFPYNAGINPVNPTAPDNTVGTTDPAAGTNRGETTAPDSASATPAKFHEEVLQLVNQYRTSAGLGTLSMDGELANMAMVKAKDMHDNHYFSHNSPTYGSPFDMMKQFGITYRSAGENIASGQSSPTQVMNDWMNSPGHRANILNTSFSKIGVAYYNGEWVQEFIG
jgi:uncharacterized YkwD family protein